MEEEKCTADFQKLPKIVIGICGGSLLSTLGGLFATVGVNSERNKPTSSISFLLNTERWQI